MNPEWFRKYMNLVASNIMDRTGKVRFNYITMRTSLNALQEGKDELVPQPVLELFRNIVGALPKIELNDRQQVTLLLALLNCHMAYGLVSGYTLKEDVSVENRS